MSIKEYLRVVRLAIGKALLDKSPLATRPTCPQRFLFLHHDGKIGDIIVSSFVFRELKKHFPDCEISLVCSASNQALLQKFSEIDKFYTLPKRHLKARYQLGKLLCQQNIDYVFYPNVLLRNRDLWLLRLIKAKNNIGFLKANYRIFNLNIHNAQQHFSDVYKEMLQLVIKQEINTHYEIPESNDAEEKVNVFLENVHLGEYLALNLFGAAARRQFSALKAKQLIDYLLKHTQKNIVLLGFPSVMTKLKHYQQNCCDPHRVFIYEDTQTIFDNIALIKRASLCISPDTSIVHIAAGLNKPLISFYSDDEENFQHWHPKSQSESHVLRYAKSVDNLEIENIHPAWLP